MRWTVRQVAEALGVAAPGGVDGQARVAGVSIDSRSVGAGEVFIAIHGARHDGHAFVGAALERGAVACVVARARLVEYRAEWRGRLYGVEDTLEALQRLARKVGEEWRAGNAGRRVAAVTGSTGKTTTKEILAALLGARCRVLKNEGNLNNEYGVPLTLLRLTEEHDAAVLELGMSHRGEIAQLARLAEPEVGVVTCVAPVHLEFFKSVEEIAEAKRELIENLRSGESGSSRLEFRKAKNEKRKAESDAGSEFPVAVLNADDARVMKFAEGFAGRVVTFGFGGEADYRAENIEDRGVEGSAFDVVISAESAVKTREILRSAPLADARGKQDDGTRNAGLRPGATRARVELALVGRHNVMNALAALAAASVWGVGAEEAKEVFPTLRPAAMRGEVLKFESGFTVINDSYNSNPLALTTMIGLLAGTMGYRRRILAAGEMLELGGAAARLHREGGQLAGSMGLDWIFGVQGQADEFVLGAEEAGQAPTRTRFFETSEEAATYLCEFVEAGDLLLVKGSRGVKMERIVEALAGKYAKATGVRQTEKT